jgi:hypothetical protein
MLVMLVESCSYINTLAVAEKVQVPKYKNGKAGRENARTKSMQCRRWTDAQAPCKQTAVIGLAKILVLIYYVANMQSTVSFLVQCLLVTIANDVPKNARRGSVLHNREKHLLNANILMVLRQLWQLVRLNLVRVVHFFVALVELQVRPSVQLTKPLLPPYVQSPTGALCPSFAQVLPGRLISAPTSEPSTSVPFGKTHAPVLMLSVASRY